MHAVCFPLQRERGFTSTAVLQHSAALSREGQPFPGRDLNPSGSESFWGAMWDRWRVRDFLSISCLETLVKQATPTAPNKAKPGPRDGAEEIQSRNPGARFSFLQYLRRH